MIREIYIDNFRCLTNFRIEPGTYQLWLGDNGSGKTSTLDVLRSIQRLLRGEHIEDIFSITSLTTWDRRDEQTIGFSLMIDEEQYDYELIIEYYHRENKARIKREELKWKNSTFFLFDGKDAHLYRINRDTNQVEKGTHFTADWSRSIIATIAKREDNLPLLRFREEINKWLIIQPVPLVVKQVADSEARNLSSHAENFAQWYRHVLQEEPGSVPLVVKS
ncbi:MAG: AAA family ATPase [Candidatus Nealsonbacteria bacterium]|nr:AAA family ATPase [Candidatus Nealsonbacteria bacterium]